MSVSGVRSSGHTRSTSRTRKKSSAHKTHRKSRTHRTRRSQKAHHADRSHISHEAKKPEQSGAGHAMAQGLGQTFSPRTPLGQGRHAEPVPQVKPGGPQGTFHAKGTGYYPANNAMEGGMKDRRGKDLQTLQDFLSGKSKYVSVAMDKKMKIPYGKQLSIPELDKKYAGELKKLGLEHIPFRVVDTGGAFTGKGTSRIDIATADRKASLDPTINGPLTLQFGE